MMRSPFRSRKGSKFSNSGIGNGKKAVAEQAKSEVFRVCFAVWVGPPIATILFRGPWVFALAASGAADTTPPMDKLEEIFQLQKLLNERIGVSLENLSEEEQGKWVLNYTRAMQQEMSELIDSVPWKWWAKYQTFDRQNARVEVIDLFHFLISIAQTLGMTADDVYDAYLAKNKVNHARQDSGYSAKDHDDSRHI